jgi:hypothetical protein
MLLFSSVIAMAVLAFVGWLRGAIRLAGAFLALLLSGLLANPFRFLTRPVVRSLDVPELLVPTSSTFATGLLLFVVFLIGVSHFIKKRWGEDLPEWDKPVGSLLGAVWGIILILFTLVGLSTIARADRAMREAVAETELRAQARIKIERKVKKELEPLSYRLDPEEYERQEKQAVTKRMREYKPEPEQIQELVQAGSLDPFLESLKSSPLRGTVNSFSLINEQSERVLRDLTIVVGDPVLMDRFQRHKTISELVKEPVFQALSGDEEIALAVREKRFRDLLDHPKIVAAAREPNLRKKLSKVDLEAILAEVKGP